MPAATKKVVNPEKEMRGKRPYNRAGPGGIKKKSYQAKPAKLDQGEVPEGAAALKKKLRDTLRLLGSNDKMPADVRLDKEKRVEALKLQIAEKQVNQKEQTMQAKYRMLKFFESKKAERKIKVFKNQNSEWESNPEQKKELEELELDLAYVQNFPKAEKYLALYPIEGADDPKVQEQRQEIREKIRLGLASGEIQQFAKAVREEIKAKIVSKDSKTVQDDVRLTAEKIQKGKKRSREQAAADENDPLSGRAKATAQRQATKPKQTEAVVEESFFETVAPKVVAAKEATEPAKKKVAVEKKTPAAKDTTAKTTEGGAEEPKKLGKWARKAIRAQSTFTAQEGETKTEGTDDSSKETAAPAPMEVEPVKAGEKKVIEKKQPEKKAAAEKKQPAPKKASAAEKKPAAEKKVVEKKQQPAPKKAAEKKKEPVAKKQETEASAPATTESPETSEQTERTPKSAKRARKKEMYKAAREAEAATKTQTETVEAVKEPEVQKEDAKKEEVKKVVEKKPEPKKKAETKPAAAIEKKKPEPKKKIEPKITPAIVVEKKIEEPVKKAEEVKVTVKEDKPKITVLKVDRDDLVSDSDNDDEPTAPVRKVVAIDMSQLKELPEVPKRRGGRNLNKFK
ncbi:18S rRNA maturation protein [Gryganskiella cystojenkinii]|nr:18S rRNA maturation protein [Gryganskiella cystojenkinii]